MIFIDAVWPEHPQTVVVHDETRIQVRNDIERLLIAPVWRRWQTRVRTSSIPAKACVVVPHRAQGGAAGGAGRQLGPHTDLDRPR